jgi:hypothetical protein
MYSSVIAVRGYQSLDDNKYRGMEYTSVVVDDSVYPLLTRKQFEVLQKLICKYDEEKKAKMRSIGLREFS